MVTVVLEKLALMLLIVLLGILCRRKGLLDGDLTVKLSNFLLTIVNPLVIFVSYQMDFDAALLKDLGVTLGLSAAAFAVQILLVHLLVPGKRGLDAAIERLSAIYGNCGFIGIPLISGLFGREGVFYMTAYLTVFYLFFWTHGVVLMTGKTTLRETAKNLLSPAILGVVLGLACFLLRIRLPSVVVDAMDSVGSMNTPLAMLVAGATLAGSDWGACLKKGRVYWISAIKLLILPAVALVLLLPLSVNGQVAMTLLVASGCPVGACCTMFALRYRGDGSYASELFAVSTIGSALTIPLLVLAAEAMQLL